MQSPDRAPSPRRDWRRAWRALGRLVEDARRTDEVFEILEALSGPADGAVRRRFERNPAGRELLRRRPDLLEALSDRAALASLPEGTLGRAYADFMEAGGISAEELAAADRERPGRSEAADSPDPDLWIGERLRDAHDLWHVVTAYGMDEAGEVALLAFSYAQLGNLGLLLIVLTAAIRGPKDWRLRWQRELWRAWRRGRRARWLATVPWEEWLVRPLVCVCRDLALEPPGLFGASRARSGFAAPTRGPVFTLRNS